jgi:AcrR family transcriptional regulator
MVAERGYHETVINDVAGAVGVSKGTILHHFGNKDGLLAEAGVSYIQRRDVELAHSFRNLERPIDQFGASIYSTIFAERDDRSASRAFGREYWLYKTDPRLERARECRETYVERVRRMIERCMADDVLREDDVNIVLLQIYGMCNYSWTWYQPEGRFSAEEISARFARTLLVGLGTPSVQTDPDQIDDERIVALLAEAAEMIEEAPSLPDLLDSVSADAP